jgi:glycosyltransferase involved in cell wall biosynthesis
MQHRSPFKAFQYRCIADSETGSAAPLSDPQFCCIGKCGFRLISTGPTSERPIRVLVLIPTLEIGGAEMDLVRNLPRLDPNRFKVLVCAFLARGPLAQPLLDARIEVIGPIVPKRSGSLQGGRVSALLRRLLRRRNRLPRKLRRSWRYLRRMVSIPEVPPYAVAILAYLRIGAAVSARIRNREIEVVHAVLPNSYVVAGIAKVLARRPLVMSRVSLNWYQERDALLGVFERRVLHRMVDAVICNSTAIRQELMAEGVAASKIRQISNGIDLHEFSGGEVDRDQARERLGISPSALVLSVVASLQTYKGHADLLRALQLVRDRLPAGWVLLAPGRDVDGNLHRMQRLSEELGLATCARFLGERDDIAAILRAADIHVSASHTEGFPNNILEAMCTGLPVIATAVGGVPEMVVDGVTGLLVPPGDPEAMARALDQLAADPARRAAMGTQGRKRALSFSIERSVNAFAEIYAGCAARRGAG